MMRLPIQRQPGPRTDPIPTSDNTIAARRASPLTALRSGAAQDWARLVAYAAMPSLGLLSGPAYANLVFVIGGFCFLHALALRWEPVRVRPRYPVLACAFVLLAFAGVGWSVVPDVSLRAAATLTAIFAGALAFLATPARGPFEADRTDALFTTILITTALGAAIFWADRLTGYHLQGFASHRADVVAATKYNRGIDYLVLLAWPVLGWFATRRAWRRAALLAILVGAVAAGGASLAGKVACIAGVATLLLALWLPRFVAFALQAGVLAAAAAWPFVLATLADERAHLIAYLKPSGLDRLEIWDYMTFHVMQRPLLGWGLESARFLAVPASRAHHYTFVHGPGMYPHDQWLQLWVETGALGVALAAALVVCVTRAASALPPARRPFAYAAIVAALAVSAVNFEVVTDSWWAALAAAGFLFTILARHPARAAPTSVPISSANPIA